ncbi:uncharacterized protein CC84DRAFT_1163293 [Paraphaeosphaeria sporulosa]|uniref:Uncharacterized protein n=1 Tax=Paraphaeosphaeria sporulosa TaxID=1460663 RepID=A0A177CJ89_9PLEO|nr:uncharacterized protein CC84DRAFT_1163293 [Paraphaeosphaeria sporulosa]OAG07042.1 hypothetical protein CC84DRAFT_1163293 [Paraphaeosphaeria sporulosa]
MSSTMDKLKDKLHIRRKSQSEEAAFPSGSHASDVQRESFDEELAALPLEEREAYLKEFEEADKVGEHKKGGLIDRCEFDLLRSPSYVLSFSTALCRSLEARYTKVMCMRASRADTRTQ